MNPNQYYNEFKTKFLKRRTSSDKLSEEVFSIFKNYYGEERVDLQIIKEDEDKTRKILKSAIIKALKNSSNFIDFYLYFLTQPTPNSEYLVRHLNIKNFIAVNFCYRMIDINNVHRNSIVYKMYRYGMFYYYNFISANIKGHRKLYYKIIYNRYKILCNYELNSLTPDQHDKLSLILYNKYPNIIPQRYSEDISSYYYIHNCLSMSINKFKTIFDNFNFINDKNFFNIIVHFPEKVVTNENDIFTTIYDGYAKFEFNGYRLLSNKFTRATVTPKEYSNYYMHSHVKPGRFEWKDFCFGSGPISITIAKLKREESPPLYLHKLFCWEFDQYIATESLKGGPYNKLEKIIYVNKPNLTIKYSTIKDFPILSVCNSNSLNSYWLTSILYLIHNNLKIFKYKFIDGKLILNNSIVEFFNIINTLLMSNAMEVELSTLSPTIYYIDDNKLIEVIDKINDESNIDISNYREENVLTFKNNIIKSKIKNVTINKEISYIKSYSPIYFKIIYDHILLKINTTIKI